MCPTRYSSSFSVAFIDKVSSGLAYRQPSLNRFPRRTFVAASVARMYRQLRRDLRLGERLVLDGHFANPVSNLACGRRRKQVHAKSPGPVEQVDVCHDLPECRLMGTSRA